MASTAEKSGLVDNFKQWACSFSGCDGGDLKSPVWLCGIEWGYRRKKDQSVEDYKNELENYYRHEIPEQMAEGFRSYRCESYKMDEHISYQYGLKVAKLYAAIEGHNVSKARDVAKTSNGSKIFRVNLYPIAFYREHDGLWEQYGLDKVTGLESKQIYRTWCLLHRLPWIAEQVKEHSPKLFIGTGIGYLTDFVISCGGSGIVGDIHKETIIGNPEKPEDSKRTMYWARIGETTLVVIPFLGGKSGMNSDALIEKFGKKIRDISGE